MKRWRVARVVLLVLWLAGAALTWWSAPREVSYERAVAAVDGGEVRAYQWGTGWDSGGTRWFAMPVLGVSSGATGPWFAWRDDRQRVRWTDTSLAGDDAAAGLTRRLDRTPAGRLSPWDGWLQGLGVILGLTAAVLIIFGPAPALGTRPYWWWMLILAPYGLGMVLWLVRERPWVHRPAREEGRDRGWLGMVTAVLAGVAVAIVLFLLNRLLGDAWVPA